MRLKPFFKDGSKVLLSVANHSLLEYHLNHLQHQNIDDVILCVNGNYEAIHQEFGEGSDRNMRITYARESRPLGTAGALGAVREFLQDEPFLVISSHVMIDVDFSALLRFHHEKNAAATFVVAHDRDSFQMEEHIEVGEDGGINNVVRYGPGTGAQRHCLPCGVYVFDPAIFKFIDTEGQYLDLKEQLYPRLRTAGLPVFAYQHDGYSRSLNNIEDYFLMNRDVLLQRTNGCALGKEIRKNIWVGEDVQIAGGVELLGPVVVGDNTVIEAGAQIIGPVAIGANCVIERGASLRESILLEGARVGAGSRIEYAIISGDNEIAPAHVVQKAVLTNERYDTSDMNFYDDDDPFNLTRNGWGAKRAALRHKTFKGAKRLLDFVGAFSSLVLAAPVMLLVALAVRLDSRGPILFRQKRCGRNGREFTMLKFRSMVADAEEIKERLRKLNEVDGPVFKITRDPRITPVGNFIRKTSLDELPQLFNVLKGDMSFVGPRPLAKEELRYSPSWWDTRLRVKPGITGLWQINGRGNTSFQDWIHYDMFYVQHQNFWLDLKILFKTPLRLVMGSGAC